MLFESEHCYIPRVKIKLIIKLLATVSSYFPYTDKALNPTQFSQKAIFSFTPGTPLLTSTTSNH